MERANFAKIVYEDFIVEFRKFFQRVDELKQKMLVDVANGSSSIDDYEQILLEMFLTSGEIFDYMVIVLRFFISAYVKWDSFLFYK
mgnify:CR=1 FL=1